MRLVKVVWVAMVTAGVLVACSAARGEAAAEKAEKPKLRVGTFDSRAVAVAYVRSAAFKRQLQGMMQQHKEAKAAGNTEKVKQLEAEGAAQQDRLHQQGFSTAPVDNLLESIKDKLPEIARQAGVDVIVSKWAITYHDPGAAFVDVTDLIVKPFDPDEKVQRTIKDLRDKAPIPLDKLKIETHE